MFIFGKILFYKRTKFSLLKQLITKDEKWLFFIESHKLKKDREREGFKCAIIRRCLIKTKSPPTKFLQCHFSIKSVTFLQKTTSFFTPLLLLSHHQMTSVVVVVAAVAVLLLVVVICM